MGNGMAGTISSPGIGSGLDVSGIISKLMAVEQRPLTLLTNKEASFQSQISAVGALQGAFSSLESSAASLVVGKGVDPLTKFSTLSGSLDNTSLATVAVGSAAVPGVYSVEVTALASLQRLQSAANPAIPSVAGGPLTLTIETGTVAGSGSNGVGGGGAFTANAGAISLTIDSSNNTLEGIRNAINKAGGNVSATIVDDGAGNKRLQLASASTGLNNVIRVSGDIASLNYDPSTDTGALSRQQDAADASIKLNGVPVSSHSNTVTGALDGVTLTLKKADPGNAAALTITRDRSALTSLLSNLVAAYNGVRKQVVAAGSYDASTKQGGPLLGDSSLRTTDSLMRRAMFSTPAGIAGKYTTLSSLGVAVQKDGTLTFDSSKLQSAIADDFTSVTNLVSAVGQAVKSAASAISGTSGILATKIDGLNRSVKDIDRQRDALNTRLTSIQANYLKQFNALDVTLSNLQALSTRLTQQLASLPTISSSSKNN